MSARQISLGVLVCSLVACSSPRSQRRLANDAVEAMGGREKLAAITVLAMTAGTGTRFGLGQTVHVGDPETRGELKNVSDIVDLVRGRASLDYELTIGDFTQHRNEILTTRGEGVTARPVGIEIVGTRPIVATTSGGLFSWGTQNSPEFLLRRNIVTIALAAASTASDAQPSQQKELNQTMYAFANAKTLTGEAIGLYFDLETKLIAAFEMTDTETMLGDVTAQYLLSDYKAVNGIVLPHHITIRKGGKEYSDVRFASVSIDDSRAADVFAVPESAAAEADQAVAATDYTPLSLQQVADDVYFAKAYSHNSMVVEFPTFVTIVEAPYTETQSKALARLVKEQFPGKPIKYAVITHHHYDHTGGVRGIAALGATLVTEKRHQPAIQELVDARHTQPQDDLDRMRGPEPAKKPVMIETYEEQKVISEGDRRLELYAITGSSHADPMVLAYVPASRPRGPLALSLSKGVLFQSDLWFPGTGGAGHPLAKHLLDSVRALGLKVDVNVGGHGGVGPFTELVVAVDTMAAPAK